jgi:starch synthase
VPIVRQTGGLADTVHDYNANQETGDGFTFIDYHAKDLLDAIRRAVDLFLHNQTAWEQIQRRGMNYDYSWSASAKHYISLYLKAIEKVII